MASYDSDQIKVKGGGYILEAGEYTISLRSDSHNVIDEVSFTVDSDIDYSKTGRASDDTPAVNHMDDARGTFEQPPARTASPTSTRPPPPPPMKTTS